MSTIVQYAHNNDSSVELHNAGVNDDVWAAQTFTLSAEAAVTGFSVKLYREGTPGNTALVFAPVDGDGKPDYDNRYYTIGFSARTMTTDSGGEWREILPTSVDVPAGTYALLLNGGTTDDTDNCAHWNHDATSAAFSGGHRWHSTDDMVTWTEYTTQDFMFKVHGYMFNPPASGPTVKLLVAVADDALYYEDV